VLAGTQGMRNHQKTDRMLGVALQNKLPVVLFAEGGGGRPGDVDVAIVAGLNLATFASFARLNGQVPVVGVVAEESGIGAVTGIWPGFFLLQAARMADAATTEPPRMKDRRWGTPKKPALSASVAPVAGSSS
jgi:acetyl-CoA carboxylase carboxyltransferase component